MIRKTWCGVCAGTLMIFSAPAAADTLFEVEHARASARAGGPVSSQDAELLERYGALSGTPEWRHRIRETFYLYEDEPRAWRKHRRRVYRD